MLAQNPFQWAQEVLRPIIEQRFGKDANAQNPEVIGFLGNLFGNRMAASAMAILTLQTRRLTKDASLIEQAHGLDQAADLLKNDPTAVMNRFKASWENSIYGLRRAARRTKAQNDERDFGCHGQDDRLGRGESGQS